MREIASVQITNIPLAKLVRNTGQIEGLPANPRFIKDNNFEKLVRSIQENPEMLALRELLVFAIDGGKFVVIGGNMRLEAMRKLRIPEAPCKIIPPETTVEQLKAYTIKDNAGYGEWDFAMLANDWDPELLVNACIEIPEMPLEEPEETTEDEFDEDKDTVEARTEAGDLWILGRHRLLCGDSTKPEDVQRLMNGEKADMLLTDPPYNVDYEGSDGQKIQNDKMGDSQFLAFLTDAFKAANQALKSGGAIYIWHADSEGYNFRSAFKLAGWTLRQCIIWVKNSLVLGRQDYQWKHEPCLYGWKEGAAHYFVDSRCETTTIEDEPQDFEKMKKDELVELLKKIYSDKVETTTIYENKPARNADHPTMKPINLLARLIKNSSRQGQNVLDTFAGSGSTLIACEQLNRNCYTMELDPHYCDVVVARWEKFTGGCAQKYKAEIQQNDTKS